MIIYKITNKLNGKVYVGLTRYSLSHRWYQHTIKNSALGSAIRKYGKEHFSKEIIGNYINLEDLLNAEQYFIEYHNSLAPLGYNITAGGEAAKHSEESKLKLSEARKGSKNPQFGKKQSAATKLKRSLALKGRKRPLEVIEKIKLNHNPKSNLNLTYRRKVLTQ